VACGNAPVYHPPHKISDRLAESSLGGTATGDTVRRGITTETRQVATHTKSEASDLVLRIGRLAYHDPLWTPAKEHSQAAARPAPDGSAISDIIGAVHQAADALAVMAAANLASVTAADAAGRLYIPTRTLSEGRNVPRPFAPASAAHVTPLLTAYQTAVAASQAAADQLADLALAAGAPSRPLALARLATREPHDHQERHNHQDSSAARLAARDRPQAPSSTFNRSTPPEDSRHQRRPIRPAPDRSLTTRPTVK
jgi:hypothetical protein